MDSNLIKELENIDHNTFNFVYSVNGITLITSKEYNSRLDEIYKLKQENQQLKIFVENLKLGVTLNEEQEKLLDSILFGRDKHE